MPKITKQGGVTDVQASGFVPGRADDVEGGATSVPRDDLGEADAQTVLAPNEEMREGADGVHAGGDPAGSGGDPVDPAAAESVTRPRQNDGKPEWVKWATRAHGLSHDEADAMTKDQLVALGDPKQR